jgi:hypothetical protein
MKLLGAISVMHTVKHKGGKITEDLDIIQNILDIEPDTDIDVLKKQLKISLIIEAQNNFGRIKVLSENFREIYV